MDGTQIATTAGGLIAAAISGAIGWFTGRGKRERESAANNAAIADYRADQTVSDASTAQIKLLMDRVQSLETKYSALWDELQAEKQASSKLRERVHQLEGILRQNNIQVPPEVK